LERNQYLMATCMDHHSNLADCIEYPVFQRPGLRINSQIAAFPAKEKKDKKEHPISSMPQEGSLFQDSLVVSGAKSRPRNPWATAASIAFPLLLLARNCWGVAHPLAVATEPHEHHQSEANQIPSPARDSHRESGQSR